MILPPYWMWYAMCVMTPMITLISWYCVARRLGLGFGSERIYREGEKRLGSSVESRNLLQLLLSSSATLPSYLPHQPTHTTNGFFHQLHRYRPHPHLLRPH
ncbi:hypothetical protein BJ165DRAFT_12657 [Panaeolus papilionaceus]|nr:hypothetical protein BJ165DRAFT_12657 [Panaeolus papilionaceus]